MTWSSYASWFAGPLLEIILLTCMIRSGSRRTFPRFFSYVFFQIVKSVVLFFAFRYFGEDAYFEAYWTGNALSVTFAVVVMDEILRRIFDEFGSTQRLVTTIFRWSCGLLFLLAIIGTFSSGEDRAERIMAVVISFDRNLRLMEVGLFLLLMILCRLLGNFWRQPVFGIALGFGVFASVELILVSFVIWHGSNGHAATISLVKSLAYNLVTLVWIGYLRREPHLVPRLEPVSPMSPDFAMATAGMSDPDHFMVRVEQAVDRVLSRSDWPRPATNRSRVVGRRPSPEESN